MKSDNSLNNQLHTEASTENKSEIMSSSSQNWMRNISTIIGKTSLKVKMLFILLFVSLGVTVYASVSTINFRSAQAEETSVGLSFDQAQLNMVPNETKQIKVLADIPLAQKFTAVELAISYDPQKIHSLEIAPLNTLKALSEQTNTVINPNKIIAKRILVVNCESVCQTLSGSAEIASLNVKTQSPVQNGNSTIEIDSSSYISVISTDLNALRSTSSSIALSITGGEEVPLPNPVAEWKMDSISGTSTTDSSGNNNSLTLAQATSNNDSVSGNSLKFSNNSYAYLDRNNANGAFPASSPNTAEDFTLSSWVKLDRLNQRNPIISKQGNESRGFLLSVEDNNRVTFELFRDANVKTIVQASSSLQDNTWYHVVASYDYVSNGSSIVRLYVNGQEVGSSSSAVGPITSNQQNIELGRYYWNSSYSRFLSGSLDNVSIYSSTLASSVIPQLYDSQLTGGSPSPTPTAPASPTATPTPSSTPTPTPTPTPVPTSQPSEALSHWSFNEGSGNSASSDGNNSSSLELSNISWSAGILSSAIELNGSSSYGRSTNSSLNASFSNQEGNSGDFTLAAWIKLDKLGHRHPIMSKQANEQRGFLFSVEENNKLQLQFYKNNSSYNNVASSNSLDTNWHHVAVTYDYVSDGTSIITLYIDGQQVGQNTNSVGPLIQNSQQFELGRYYWSGSYNRYFDGMIDEAYVFNKALDQGAIENLASN